VRNNNCNGGGDDDDDNNINFLRKTGILETLHMIQKVLQS
jgi:hypothetical protein